MSPEQETALETGRRVLATEGRAPRVIGAEALASRAVAEMNADPPCTALFVLAPDEDARRPVGLIHIHDCLRAGLN